jgi:hypothetical protein
VHELLGGPQGKGDEEQGRPRRFSATVIDPKADKACRIFSRAPGMASTSGGLSQRRRPYRTTDMMAAYGPAVANHWGHVTLRPSIASTNPSPTMFWGAAVLRPMFQIEAASAAAIIKRPPKRLRRSRPTAARMPRMIGTRAAIRPRAEGMTKLRMAVKRITPARIPRAPEPSRIRTRSAIRRSRPVIVMAAAMKSGSANSARAGFANP